MGIPTVAIVGRPNVGKSSLLNALAGEMISIVEPTAGVTRDRVSTFISRDEQYFELIDTGGYGIVDSDALSETYRRADPPGDRLGRPRDVRGRYPQMASRPWTNASPNCSASTTSTSSAWRTRPTAPRCSPRRGSSSGWASGSSSASQPRTTSTRLSCSTPSSKGSNTTTPTGPRRSRS